MDPSDLGRIYDNMARGFSTAGVNTQEIANLSRGFDLAGPLVQPLRFDQYPEPFPPAAVRLVVIPLQGHPQLVERLALLAQDVQAVLPKDCQSFSNPPPRYHCTVFHTSQPSDPRPDPYVEGGGANSLPPAARPPPSDSVLARESATMTAIAATAPAFELEVHSIVFASSGTLLLCSTDPSGTLNQIRSELRAAFPGRPTKQAGIAHTTLLRLMTPEQLPPECIAAIQEICHRHTASLKGLKISVDQLWYIIEEVFSTIEGPQQDCKLQQKG
ncbi:hypothetical protein WJX84_011658 [Apatococcus fuscideae]|uniref:Uncharacterized protein n=1 Tax=Apatococcus fuscideae TaxID=2026836 RepID=A0AAW1SN55_9CHLO